VVEKRKDHRHVVLEPAFSGEVEVSVLPLAIRGDDEEVVATVAYLINSGRVRLCGTFAGAKITLRPALPLSLRDECTHGMTP